LGSQNTRDILEKTLAGPASTPSSIAMTARRW